MAILPGQPHGGQSIEGHVTHSERKGALNTCESKVERRLGETEVSYYLPSRESGTNDMYAPYTFLCTLFEPIFQGIYTWACMRRQRLYNAPA